MTKVARLNYIENPEEFISVVDNRELLIYEDVQGSKIFVNYNGLDFSIKPKSMRSEELNFIDLATQKYYNQAYFFFSNMDKCVSELLNKRWTFCFEYFPDSQPANVKYNRTPKNNMILTCIVKGDKYIYDYDELNEYAKLFDVESLPVLFKGKLSSKQLEIINLYLNTSDEDLEYVFGEDNFTYFFYKLLNPNLKSSFMMSDGEFNDNTEKITIRIDNNSEYSFDIINPTYERIRIENTKFMETYSLILLSFLNYGQLIDFDNIKLKSINRNEAYIEYMCSLFNDYVSENEKYLKNWDFEVPTFFKDDKFKINQFLIKDKKTIANIQNNEKNEYILKVLFGSMNKKKKKSFGVFDKQTLDLYNKLIENIGGKIDKDLKINVDYILQKSDVKNFTDFFKIKYDIDSTGEVYPDVFDELSDMGTEQGGDKKKKKKDKFIDMDFKKIKK